MKLNVSLFQEIVCYLYRIASQLLCAYFKNRGWKVIYLGSVLKLIYIFLKFYVSRYVIFSSLA